MAIEVIVNEEAANVSKIFGPKNLNTLGIDSLETIKDTVCTYGAVQGFADNIDKISTVGGVTFTKNVINLIKINPILLFI
jgi:hypothetical protein